MKQPHSLQRTFILLTTRNVLLFSAIVIILTIESVKFLLTNNNLFQKTIDVISILSVILFIFLSIGLYKGIKLRDNVRKLFKIKQINNEKQVAAKTNILDGFDFLSCFEPDSYFFVIAIIVVFILIVIPAEVIGIEGGVIGAFILMLNWICFRALRLVFNKSSQCKDNFFRSTLYGLIYTILYSSWIYGVILGIYYLFKTSGSSIAL